MGITWPKIEKLQSRDYICGYCGAPLASELGWHSTFANAPYSYIYVCHRCDRPTYFEKNGEQFPGVAYGNPVYDIPDKLVESLYEEARICTAYNAFTSAVLCCRKLLMNIAVSKGAPKDQNFIDYVEYLSSKGFVPPDGKDWVDHIRKKGNEATHEIAMIKKEDAEDLLSFLEMLLKFIFEFPAKMNRKSSANTEHTAE